MAKSIRSKAKRKLRAAKREKIAAKERIKLLAIREQEEGIKMVQDTTENTELRGNATPLTTSEDGNDSMEVVSEDQSVVKSKKKRKSKTKKNVKRLNKKKKNRYKW